MSKPTAVRTDVEHASGPTHTGSGDQHVTYQNFVTEARRHLVASPVDRTSIARLRERFVEPWNISLVAEALRSNGMVVLSGEPGTGRTSAARMLGEQHSEHRRVHQLPIESDVEQAFEFDLDQVTAGDTAILDLSSCHRQDFATWVEKFNQAASTLHRQRAFCVAIIGREQERWHDDLRPHIHQIRKPPPFEVLAKHFNVERLPYPDNAEEHLRFVERLPMSAIDEFTQVVADERDIKPDDDPSSWFKHAAKVVDGHPEIAKLLDDHRDARERTMLLTAAALDGAPIEAVAWAEHTLARRAGCTLEPTWVEEPGVRQRLLKIGAQLHRDRRVRFPRPNYATAVVDRLWDEFAGAQPMIARWLGDVAASTALSDIDRAAIADLLARQLLRSGNAQLFAEIAENWAKHTAPSVQALAFRLVLAGKTEDTDRGLVRRQLWSWARQTSLPRQLAYVVIALAEEDIATQFPETAWDLLRGMTRHRTTQVRETATAIILYKSTDRSTYHQALAVFHHFSEVGTEAFAALLDRYFQRYTDDREITKLVENWWANIMTAPGRWTSTWKPLTWYWLSRGNNPREQVEFLVDSIGVSRQGLSRLFVAVSNWCEKTGDHDLCAYTRQLIDNALEITGSTNVSQH